MGYVFLGNSLSIIKAAKICHFGTLTITSGSKQRVDFIQVDYMSPQKPFSASCKFTIKNFGEKSS